MFNYSILALEMLNEILEKLEKIILEFQFNIEIESANCSKHKPIILDVKKSLTLYVRRRAYEIC